MSSKKKNDEIMKIDLYKLLNVAENATPKEVKKAYRTKALKCHPDKNPDNPKAAELFHQLSEALKILSDIGARAAYDHLRKAKRAAQERTDKLDAQRKKAKLDLEARERESEQDKKGAKTALMREIERLEEEGTRIVEEEQRKMREQMKEERRLAELAMSKPPTSAQLKLKWKSSKHDATNGGYDEEILRKMLSKYGELSALVLSRKKKGTAVVEFRDGNRARLAVEMELGNPKNPLKISWLSGKPEPTSGSIPETFSSQDGSNETFQTKPSSSSTSSSAPANGGDFEVYVLNRMKAEQERRRKLAEEQQMEEVG